MKICRILVIDFLIAVVVLGSAEIALRTFASRWAVPITNDFLTFGHPVRFNSLGCRGDEITPPSSSEELRIAVLGDSTTFGTGVAESKTYSNRLEASLKKSLNGKVVKVFNLGAQNGELDSAQALLKNSWEIICPSIVVYAFSQSLVSATLNYEMRARSYNITEKPSINTDIAATGDDSIKIGRVIRYHLLEIHKRLYSSYAWTTLDAVYRKNLYRLGIMRDRVDKPTGATLAYAFDTPAIDKRSVEAVYQLIEIKLESLRDLLRERHVPLVLIRIPARFEIMPGSYDNPRNFDLKKIRIFPGQNVAQICSRLDIPFRDLLPFFKESRKEMLQGSVMLDSLYVEGDYVHLNEAGHTIAATTLAPELLRLINIRPGVIYK